ncbi:MAG: 16S rRNA (cytidine(1402)-2'-O)-methyltransferase [Flavobacteriales bacterium]|nr:MAG: 16S rRNA (cytidine(1402)-2'-O)-methyltransferase [Flavobacteriales bacterium]
MSVGKLYLVPTPIGNLGDITYRAVELLNSVDKILAEDTRTTRVLLNHYGIKTRLESFHQHNEHGKLKPIIQELIDGTIIAQVSDAGTPGISDPGFLLARACLKQNIPIEVLPGATAFIPALIKSGFALHQFRFEGFLPQKKGRQTRILALSNNPDTTCFYESPHKIIKSLEQLAVVCDPKRRISISREISKKFEETVTGYIIDVLNHYKHHPAKGEFVVVLEGCNIKEEEEERSETNHSL